MKGLLIKDFKLMKMQKNFFLMMIAIVIAISFFQNEISFPLGFLPFVISLFSLSTISYDEFDNGNAFLFSLPISRKDYVKEKYLLSFLLGFGALILGLLIICVAGFLKGDTNSCGYHLGCTDNPIKPHHNTGDYAPVSAKIWS